MMTFEQYKARLIAIHEHTHKAEATLEREFVKENALAKVGDVVSYMSLSIVVEELAFYGWGRDYPTVQYSGPQLTRRGKPRACRQIIYISQDHKDFRIEK